MFGFYFFGLYFFGDYGSGLAPPFLGADVREHNEGGCGGRLKGRQGGPDAWMNWRALFDLPGIATS